MLTVTAATLQSIAVTRANPSIPTGLTQQFTATGTFSDNSTQDLTAQVTWASATPSTATIDSSGLATGIAPGTSSISATLGGVTGSTVLTVIARVTTQPVPALHGWALLMLGVVLLLVARRQLGRRHLRLRL